jgi:formylglycine-generating enzyme required for sulfatase activity
MAHVGKACVDRWEAHLVRLDERGGEQIHPHNQRPEKGVRYLARSESGVLPQAYINRVEARDACNAAGKRLCTLSEWYRACRGSAGTTYPYGWSEQKKRCNVEKPHLLAQRFGSDPRRWDYARHFNDPTLDATPGWLAKTGEYSDCHSDYGTFDMVGNLHEWVSDVVDRSLEKKLPLRDDIRDKLDVNTGHGIFMGGFFSTGSEHGRGCGFVTIGHEPAYHDYSTGFRCCKDATATSGAAR